MIQVERLSKFFGPVLALNNITFQINKGEIVGFLGLNGAGKSTTMRILTGYIPASSGTARVAGYDVMADSLEVRQQIGYLPESVPLYPEMRVEEYIYFRATLKGVPRSERWNRVDYCLERCRLREVRRRLIQTLSKGYRQRVGLADAMVHNPPILILDEPTSGLDPVQIRETLALIRELGQEHTVFLSTHILSEVEAVCERVIIISAGKVGLDQTLAEIEKDSTTLVELLAPENEISNALARVPGVGKITPKLLEDNWIALKIETESSEDVREGLARAIASRGWTIRRLERKWRTLNEAFFDVLRAQDPLSKSTPETAIQVKS